MKRISTRFMFSVTMLISSAAFGQQQYPPLLQKERLDEDPTFQLLSQENKTWVRRLTERIYAAANEWELKALRQQRLDIIKPQLLGRQFCNNMFAQTTSLDAIETNSVSRAFVVRWNDPDSNTVAHSSLFTDSHCIASDDYLIDGKRILQILPNSLTLSDQGVVAYEALYSDPDDDGKPLRSYRQGIFIEKRFITDIERKTPDDSKLHFWWRENPERLEVMLDFPVGSDSTQK